MPAISKAAAVTVAVGAVIALSAGAVFALSPKADGDGERATNVIYLVGDGMGRSHVSAARQRYVGAAGRLAMEQMPVVGQNSTYAVEKKSGQPGESDFRPNLVTDSASAATAWASGVKTYNAALGVDAKGVVVPTLMELAKKAGYATGNVSTAEITDATPAGQMSHVLARGCQGPTYSAKQCQDTEVTGQPLPLDDQRVTPVAKQIARNGTADVILGGGLSRFDAADEEALKAKGYTVLGSPATQTVATGADLKAASGSKVFGLFNKGNMTIESAKRARPNTPEAAEPSLPEMTTQAITLLKGKGVKGKGFYLQIEGAMIDKRSHANEAGQMLEEMKAFDDAVKIAVDFAKADGQTLVVTTADHENGGFNIIEKDSMTNAESRGTPDNGDRSNLANVGSVTRESTYVKDPARSAGVVNGEGAQSSTNFGPATFRTPEDPAEVKDGSPEASLWVSYLSATHTGADVPVFALGPSARKLEGQVDNTDLFDIVGTALGVAPGRS